MKPIILSFLVCTFFFNTSVFSQNMEIEMDDFLKDAITYGLEKDKFPKNLVKDILENSGEYFVGKCPICTPVERGFRNYKNNENTDAGKNKLEKSLLKQFKSQDKTARHEALKIIINKYVSQYYQVKNMNEEEMARMDGLLEEGRKTGMERKKDSFGNFCPSCDGACRIKKE